MLGKRCRWTPLPRLATERHARCQWRVVHRVRFLPPQTRLVFTEVNHHMGIRNIRSASKEEPSQKRHKIVTDGYNLGRDWFVKRALAGSLWKGHHIWWGAKVEWRTGLLEPGSKGAPAWLLLFHDLISPDITPSQVLITTFHKMDVSPSSPSSVFSFLVPPIHTDDTLSHHRFT
jgi:hypothetical protein